MMSFSSPIALVIVLSITAATALLCIVRRPALPSACAAWFIVAGVCFAFAAAGPAWNARQRPDVMVMVDCSPSTRTAAYRDQRALASRVQALLPHEARVRDVYFSDGNRLDRPPPTTTLADLPSDRTTFASPPADAILLFSDGRFELPVTSPPVFAVIDPKLEEVDDGAVTSIETRDGNRTVAITVRRDGPTSRSLAIAGERDGSPRPLPEGITITETPLDPATAQVVARVRSDAPDAWPENDELAIDPIPERPRRNWCVGDPVAADHENWQAFPRLADLPTDPADYVTPPVIALHNVAADDVSREQADRLTQYVRDLGGTLVIIGGDHAFSAGGYVGSPIDALSPLASAPPEPTTHWILLVDASGSMASPVGSDDSRTRLLAATDAVAALIPTLPPRDLLSIGTYARDLRWWVSARPAAETPATQIEPVAQGPTNLQAAIERIISESTSRQTTLHTELLVLTDADAKIDAPDQIGQQLVAAHVRVHVLATSADAVRMDNPVRLLSRLSGGTWVNETDAAKWAKGLSHLARAAFGSTVERRPLSVRFDTSLKLQPREIDAWNRVWLKHDAQPFATVADDQIALAAHQRLGLGWTVALAFEPTESELAAIVERWQSAPVDPRIDVTWDVGGPMLRVRLDAIDPAQSQYLNDLKPSLRIGDSTNALRLTSPGRYALEITAPRQPAVATVVIEGDSGPVAIARRALAGRYPAEFESLGNNRATLRELARRTGGRVIEPSDTKMIDLDALTPRRQLPLTSWFATCGALSVAVGLVQWRRG